MLDGLLGRSAFYTKSKSLIKQTKTRIEVVKRKRNATQKFLRRDIADLLANNLESTAFARADGLIAELILSSCYDFIDHVCEIVLKYLSVLQKLRECPEDCREAVASLMFAAARFSDLPELRDLRDVFQERYRSSLELYVNQKLVEHITAKPPSVENKIKLLQDIALEFSVSWDSKSFQKRMFNSVMEQKPRHSPNTTHVSNNKVATPPPLTVQKSVRDEPVHGHIEREVNGRHQLGSQTDTVPGRKDGLEHTLSKRPESTYNITKPPSYKEAAIQKVDDFQGKEHLAGVRNTEKNTSIREAIQNGTSTHGRRLEPIDSQHKVDRQRQSRKPESDSPNTLSQNKPDPRPTSNRVNIPPPVTSEVTEDGHSKSTRKQQGDVTGVPKSNIRGGIPPPYLKPRMNKHKTDDGHKEDNDTLTFSPASNGNRAEKLQTKADIPNLQNGAGAPEDGDGRGRFTEIYYKDEKNIDFTPRRRSHRKKHSRSGSTQDVEVNDEERVLRRVSTSRRKHESRKGLQILVTDDDHYEKDEEEKLIDKLLLQYSKKPSSIEPGKSRRKSNASKSPHHKAADLTNLDEDSTQTTSRSFSLPSRQVTEPKQEKVFTRAASFQPDTPAKHVHPKLPDYDDLAARFAALRATKD
ncbi:hypothetical protein RND81_06G156900 [Saponaria officinalis]|uniref:IST1-like protein n=1 Tax=Saponaria officinalis TaxID=3572 RepID=A0AAW1K6N4_SAPOF